MNPEIIKVLQGLSLPKPLRDFHVIVIMHASPKLSKFTISHILRRAFPGYKVKKIKEEGSIDSILTKYYSEEGSRYKVLLKLNL